MFPVIEVSRLPSASSFYAAITQPLGVRFISSPPALPPPSSSSSSGSHSPPSPSVTFGSAESREPLFQIRQVTSNRDRPIKTCRLVFSVESAAAVYEFHAAALRAYPLTSASITTPDGHTPSASAAKSPDHGQVSARATDHDGNIMAVTYRPYNYSSHHSSVSVGRRQHLMDRDPSRNLNWSYSSPAGEASSYYNSPRYRDVGVDYDYDYYGTAAPSASPRYHPGSRSVHRGVAAATPATATYETARQSQSPREHSKGMSTGGMAMLGVAAVGAAAGAALTYSMIRGGGERSRATSRSRDYEEATAVPSFQRRSTFPDAYPPPSYAPPRYSSYEGMRQKSTQDEKREMEDPYDDGYSRYSSSRRYRTGSSSRARSEDPFGRVPLLLAEKSASRSGGSYAGSRRSGSVMPHAPPLVSHRSTVLESEGDSFVSARSHRTVRAHDLDRDRDRDRDHDRDRDRDHGHGHSHSHSHVHGGRSRLPSTPPSASRTVSARHLSGRSKSFASARRVPLPPSGVGSSHARWDDEYPPSYDDDDDDDDDEAVHSGDDNDSIAPSDSISCVGSRGQHNRYH